MLTNPDKLLKKHTELIHSDNMKIVTHTQREKDGWFINSIMLENCEVPFKYKRKQRYKALTKGQRVNLTYYRSQEEISGLQFDMMNVIRIKIS